MEDFMKAHNKYELQQALSELKMTKVELSRLTGISYSMICYLEKGSRKGRKEIWERINGVLESNEKNKTMLQRLKSDIKLYGPDAKTNVTLEKINYRTVRVSDYVIYAEGQPMHFVTTTEHLYSLLTSIRKSPE